MVFWFFIGFVGFLLLVVLICSFILSSVILKPRIRTLDDWYREITEAGLMEHQDYLNLYKQEFKLKSRYGYILDGVVLENEKSQLPEHSHKIAVLCHGYTACKYTGLGYANLLLELGFSVVIYDHRNHGASDKAFTSMGYFEKYDLVSMLDWCYEKFGKDIKVLTHGESMGAATVLSHLAIDDRVQCTIADCGYSSLYELLRYQLRTYYHIWPYFVMPVADLMFRLRGGYRIKDVRPQDGAEQSKTPILFIHGAADRYVPTQMSKKMYDARTGPKAIYLCDGAKHAESLRKDKEKYRLIVRGFIDQYYK